MAELITARADLVVGRRRPVSAAAWSLSSRVANRELARRIRRATSLRIDGVDSVRMGYRNGLIGLGLTDRRPGYPVETLVRAGAAGWRIEQIDVDCHPRIAVSKVTGTLRGSLQAVHDMSRSLRA